MKLVPLSLNHLNLFFLYLILDFWVFVHSKTNRNKRIDYTNILPTSKLSIPWCKIHHQLNCYVECVECMGFLVSQMSRDRSARCTAVRCKFNGDWNTKYRKNMLTRATISGNHIRKLYCRIPHTCNSVLCVCVCAQCVQCSAHHDRMMNFAKTRAD